MAVLREIKYLKLRKKEQVPEIPHNIYDRRDILFKYYANLMVICQFYNDLMTKTNDVEKPLIKTGLSEIDDMLVPALETLTWENEGKDLVTSSSASFILTDSVRFEYSC